MTTIGDVIRRLRTQKGWSQGNLALRSGVTRPNISILEAGKRTNPTSRTLAKLCAALDVSTDYVLEQANLLPASINGQLAPEVDHLNKIIQSYPEGPLKEQAEEIIIQIALALSHTLDQATLDKIMEEKQGQEEPE